jgi:hypothetical protein
MIYIKRAQKAYLEYSHDTMIAFKPPQTRKKPTDVSDEYDVSYNTTDDVIHEDEKDQHNNKNTFIPDLPWTSW